MFSSLPWAFRWLFLGVMIIAAAVYLAIPLAFALFRRQRVESAAKHLEEHPGKTFLSGVGTALGLTLLVYLASQAGPLSKPLVIVLYALSWTTLLFGYAAVGLWVTGMVLPGRETLWWAMLGGGLVTVLQVIPFVGPLFLSFFLLLAFGSAALAAYRQASKSLHPHWGQDSDAGPQPGT